MNRPIVTIESPYKGNSYADLERNIRYARACLRDSLLRGESPFASHLLYTQEGVLNDKVDQERQEGIDAGIALKRLANKTVVYTDLGISKGMEYGIKAAERIGQPIEYRTLPGWGQEKHYAQNDPVVGSLLKAVL